MDVLVDETCVATLNALKRVDIVVLHLYGGKDLFVSFRKIFNFICYAYRIMYSLSYVTNQKTYIRFACARKFDWKIISCSSLVLDVDTSENQRCSIQLWKLIGYPGSNA